jgi:thermitase
MKASRALGAVLAVIVTTLAIGTATAAGSAYAPHQLIVKLAPAATSIDSGSALARLGLGERLGTVRRLGSVIVHVAGDPARVAARVSRSPVVSYAEPNYILRAAAVPNDPQFGQLWGLNNTGQAGGTADADIDAPEGWTSLGLGSFPATGGAKVGIVDTGIQKSHPDLANRVVNCAQSRGNLVFAGQIKTGCKDDNGHGTHVAGTIAARANNGIGVAGVAFNSQLAICKALGANGSGFLSDVANCITWAHDRGARVISMSLGGGASSTLQQAVDYAWQGGGTAGSVLVAAAGNDSNSSLEYPAAYGNVVSVAATDRNDQHASFSNTNNDVEVAAPGVDVFSTYSGSTYRTLSGTSMATPHVAGVTALLWGRFPTARADAIVARLDAATDDLGAAGRDPVFGFGRVNLQKAATG